MACRFEFYSKNAVNVKLITVKNKNAPIHYKLSI